MHALGLCRLRNLEPRKPVQRYQWERPGDLIHVDTKQLVRFERVGHRFTGDRRLPGLGSQAHPHQPLHATHQRQCGAFHQNPPGGKG